MKGVQHTMASYFVLNMCRGLMAGAFIFLLFSMLQMRDSIFQRPHPAVWRIVMGAGVIYLIILVFLLFQVRHSSLVMRSNAISLYIVSLKYNSITN